MYLIFHLWVVFAGLVFQRGMYLQSFPPLPPTISAAMAT